MCFIRINPSSAPLNPPGAAPTLTTIYDEPATLHISTTTSPSDSLSKEPPTPKQKPKRQKRPNLFGAKAAKEGVVGTEKEKRRTQTIADSLDLGGDLQMDEENGGRRLVGEGDAMLGRRNTVATDTGLGSVLEEAIPATESPIFSPQEIEQIIQISPPNIPASFSHVDPDNQVAIIPIKKKKKKENPYISLSSHPIRFQLKKRHTELPSPSAPPARV